MNKEFVTYKQSLALKELGFDEPCMASRDMNNGEGLIQIPLKQQVFRWFREEFGLNYEITAAGYPGEYHAFVQNYIYGNNGNSPSVFSYEEAESACIDKLIQLIKGGKNE